MSGYVAAVCSEAGVRVGTDVSLLKSPRLAKNHSNMSETVGVALTNGQKDLPVWVALEL